MTEWHKLDMTRGSFVSYKMIVYLDMFGAFMECWISSNTDDSLVITEQQDGLGNVDAEVVEQLT